VVFAPAEQIRYLLFEESRLTAGSAGGEWQESGHVI
jgi:hypothetical protein